MGGLGITSHHIGAMIHCFFGVLWGSGLCSSGRGVDAEHDAEVTALQVRGGGVLCGCPGY